MFGTPSAFLKMQAFGFAAAFLLVSLTTWSQYPGYQQTADYTMTIVGEHQVMPIPPLFGFGSFTASVAGLTKVEGRANATTDAALAAGGGDAQGLADYGRRIAGWAKRLRDLGTASNADEQTYVLELTQFGEINLNGAPLNQR